MCRLFLQITKFRVAKVSIFLSLILILSNIHNINVLASENVASGEYQLDKFGKHKVHLLRLDPAKYEMKIVSSHDSVFGRQQVDDITTRVNGDIGVNAGFFEIGANKDGMPSGALVIDGKFYGMHSKNLPCIIQSGDKVKIDKFQPSLTVDIAGKKLKINRFNKFINNNKTYIHNDVWGKTTLSAYDSRNEIVIDESGKIISFNDHGNSMIPTGGHVISLARGNNFDKSIVGKKAKFNWQPSFIDNQDCGVILGIPQLIDNGKIIQGLNKTAPNARTAFGVTKEGHYVIAVVEHFNMQDIKNLTLNDVNEMLKNEDVQSNDMSVAELKKFIHMKLKSNASTIGLSTQELAEYMLTQGCISAINLDGGGSSSLYMNGMFINEAFGDIDENMGMQVHRSVANALVFKKR